MSWSSLFSPFNLTSLGWHLEYTSKTFCVSYPNLLFIIDIILNNSMARIEEWVFVYWVCCSIVGICKCGLQQ